MTPGLVPEVDVKRDAGFFAFNAGLDDALILQWYDAMMWGFALVAGLKSRERTDSDQYKHKRAFKN